MGMYNAVIDDELLNPLGIVKERLSQSALVAEMSRVSDQEAHSVRRWLDTAGMTSTSALTLSASITSKGSKTPCPCVSDIPWA